MVVDWSRWERVAVGGWERVPPPVCPRCGATWTRHGARRPLERSVGCTCTVQRRHTTWRCPACGAYVAEGCRDVALWVASTAPVDLPFELRATTLPAGGRSRPGA